MKKVFNKGESAFLVITCLINLFLLILGLNGDCPITFESDEVDYAPHALWMMFKPTLDPEWFVNPASTLYYPLLAYYSVLKAIYGTALFDPLKDEMRTCYEHMDLLVRDPRYLNVLLTTGTLPLIYLVGRKWLGKGPAMIGTLIYAISPEVIRYGQILRTDVMSCFFVALGILLVLFIADDPQRMKYAVWTALVTALGTSTRYFCVALVAPIFSAYSLAILQLKNAKIFFNAVLCAILCPAFFFCISPYVILDFERVVQDLRFETQSIFGGITGLGFDGNLRYYLFEGMPFCIGNVLSCLFAVGLILVLWQKRNKYTLHILVMLLAFFVGTCLNPRHWTRWLLPMLPTICLCAGFAITFCHLVLKRILSIALKADRAQKIATIIVSLGLLISLLQPLRILVLLEMDKMRPSGPAEAWFYIRDHIPHDTKIALDLDWRWTGKWLYDVKEDVWRPDFIPPRPHSYQSPVDLAKEGYQYMVVEMWTRAYYTWGEPQNYPTECHFYTELRKHAPLIFTSVKHYQILGGEPYLRCSPYEIYDLRPLVDGIKNPNEELNPPKTY